MSIRTLNSLSVLLVTVQLLQTRPLGAEPKFLNRSIYLPVTFTVCEHLHEALYHENDQLVSTLPVSRVFQFTYYPNLKKLLPLQTQVRVEGRYLESGEPFVARVAVTAKGFYTSDTHRPIDVAEDLERLRFKRDSRHERVALRLACDRFCSNKIVGASARLTPAGSDDAISKPAKPMVEAETKSRPRPGGIPGVDP